MPWVPGLEQEVLPQGAVWDDACGVMRDMDDAFEIQSEGGPNAYTTFL